MGLGVVVLAYGCGGFRVVTSGVKWVRGRLLLFEVRWLYILVGALVLKFGRTIVFRGSVVIVRTNSCAVLRDLSDFVMTIGLLGRPCFVV